MYPTVSDLLNDLFGLSIRLPFPMFGFWVAISFAIAAWLFTIELKRKEELGWLSAKMVKRKIGEKASFGELLSNAIIGFIVGFKILEMIFHYGDLVDDPQHFMLSARGNLFGGIIGAAAFAYLRYREKNKEKLPKPKWVDVKVRPYELVGNMTLIAAVSGILGAKLFHNLENIDEFIHDPVDALLSFSGLSIYGGLIIGGFSVVYYAVKQGLGWVHVVDACAPGLMAAYGTGRIGCQLSGDGDWGLPNDAAKPDWLSWAPDWVWAYDYPNNVLGIDLKRDFESMGLESITGNAWPTPFYETIMAGIIFLILWRLRKRLAIPGVIFSMYLVFNGIERFFIEKIRINPDYHFLGIEATQAEIISILLFVSGLFGIWFFSRNRQRFIPKTQTSGDT